MVLKDFIERKLATHKQQGVSVPKRGPAGSPEKRYEASLRALERKTLAKTAEALKLKNPDTIRKWHSGTSDSGKKFQSLVKEHCREFARVYEETLLAHKRLGKALHNYLQGELFAAQNEVLEPPPDIFTVLRHNDNYGFRLRETLVRWLMNLVETTGDEEATIVFLSAIAVLMTPGKEHLHRSYLLEKEREIKYQVRLICISEITRKLHRNDFRERERRMVVCLLNIIQELDK